MSKKGEERVLRKQYVSYGSGSVKMLDMCLMKHGRYGFPIFDKGEKLKECEVLFCHVCEDPFDIVDYYYKISSSIRLGNMIDAWKVYTNRVSAFIQQLKPEFFVMITDAISADFWAAELSEISSNDRWYKYGAKGGANDPLFISVNCVFLEPTMKSPHQVLIAARRAHTAEERLEYDKKHPQCTKPIHPVQQVEWLKGSSVETVCKWLCKEVMPWSPIGDLCVSRSPLMRIATECGREFVGIDGNVQYLNNLLREEAAK